MKFCQRFFSIVLLSSFAVYAEAASGIVQIYQKALMQDAIIFAERAAAIAGQEKEKQALSRLLPSLSAEANIGYAYSKSTYPDNNRFNTSNKFDSNSISVQLIQPLFHLTNYNAYSQSQLVSKQSQIQLGIAEQSLILRVAKAYFDILSANESLSVANAQTLAFKESLERAKLTFDVGTTTKTDKLEAQARYDLARASGLLALNQQTIAQQALSSIIGEIPRKLQTLSKNASLPQVVPQNIAHWVDSASVNNLTVKLSQLNLKDAQLEIKKMKSDRMPVIDFIARGSRGEQYSIFANSDNTSLNMSVGLQLSVPLYSGGLITSRIREAEALRTQQKYTHVDIRRQVKRQTQQAYLTALNSFQQIEALKQATVSSASALQATQKGMEAGVRTNLDVLNSQQQFFATERDYTVAKYTYLLMVLDLKAAAGNLVADDIKRLGQLLAH